MTGFCHGDSQRAPTTQTAKVMLPLAVLLWSPRYIVCPQEGTVVAIICHGSQLLFCAYLASVSHSLSQSIEDAARAASPGIDTSEGMGQMIMIRSPA